MTAALEVRYLRWRAAVTRAVWCIDRHWYALLGRLYPAPPKPAGYWHTYDPRRCEITIGGKPMPGITSVTWTDNADGVEHRLEVSRAPQSNRLDRVDIHH